tara:strand:- start:4172 stop:4513 length:342 start_codon:yes stop_codon:yes gene_type:complete
MFKTLLTLLFILILIGYVFSEPVSSSTSPMKDLALNDAYIQANNVPPPDEPTYTLEEDIVNNMKTTNKSIKKYKKYDDSSDSSSDDDWKNTNVSVSPTYQPLLSNAPSGFNLE